MSHRRDREEAGGLGRDRRGALRVGMQTTLTRLKAAAETPSGAADR